MVPVVVLVLTVAAIATVWLLVQRADVSRRAQLQVASLNASLADLQSAPFNAMPNAAATNTAIRRQIQRDEQTIFRGLTVRTQVGVPSGLLAAGRSSLAALEPVLGKIYATATEAGGLTAAEARLPALHARLSAGDVALASVLDRLSRVEAANASRARSQVKLGAAAAMLLLLAAFAFFYFRSIKSRESVAGLVREKEALLAEKEALLGMSRMEASTDALTGLPNRRALAAAMAEPVGAVERLLVMFDLDGFKQYNDTFGHPSGDALLRRLGQRLASAVGDTGSAYRLGGDEFCVLASCAPDIAERLLDDALAALNESGDGWHIASSHGAVWIPSEAAKSDALKLADERMYANKASRSSASRQITDVLLQVITEQNAPLDGHVERVAALSAKTAEALELPEPEVWLIRLAGELHDVGKTAIPDAILEKPGPLDKHEWGFIRRHPLIGERIVLAAPALASTAPLIRSSHEHFDGHGYPDKLVGEEIPLGARIIAVCDAFDAMTSDRAYKPAMSFEAALVELEAHAGSQFDATVVRAFCRTIAAPAIATSIVHRPAIIEH